MKILILSIYNENDIYNKMLEIQKKYIHKKDNIDVYFIKYGNHDEEIVVNNNIISFKGDESPMKITKKTIMALDYLLNIEQKKYDFVIRTNVSTIINLNNLEKYLENVPNECFYCGGIKLSIAWMDYKYGINEETTLKYNLNNFTFAQGTSIILSFDIAKYILDHDKLINHKIVDDVAIGILLRDYKNDVYNNIYKNGPSISVNEYTESAVFIRNCLFTDDNENRVLDIERMKNIILNFNVLY